MFFEYFGFFVPFSGIEWYFKLPLTVPLSPAEMSLNGPMVLNDTEWYSTVISGIPLTLFCKGDDDLVLLVTHPAVVGTPRRRAHDVRVPVRLRRTAPVELAVGPLPRPGPLQWSAAHLLAVGAVRPHGARGHLAADTAPRDSGHHARDRRRVGAAPIEVAVDDVMGHRAALEAPLTPIHGLI